MSKHNSQRRIIRARMKAGLPVTKLEARLAHKHGKRIAGKVIQMVGHAGNK